MKIEVAATTLHNINSDFGAMPTDGKLVINIIDLLTWSKKDKDDDATISMSPQHHYTPSATPRRPRFSRLHAWFLAPTVDPAEWDHGIVNLKLKTYFLKTYGIVNLKLKLTCSKLNQHFPNFRHLLVLSNLAIPQSYAC